MPLVYLEGGKRGQEIRRTNNESSAKDKTKSPIEQLMYIPIDDKFTEIQSTQRRYAVI